MPLCGIVGMPLSGKTTIFKLLSTADIKHQATTESKDKLQPNKAVVHIKDKRLEVLAKTFNSQKITYPVIELVDLIGLSKGASKGEGFGNKFLQFIRDSDAIIHVIRAFNDTHIPHPEGSIDVLRDWEIIELELILADIQSAQNRIERLKSKKKLTEEEKEEIPIMERCLDILEKEMPLREYPFTQEEKKKIKGFNFLTFKPEIVIINSDPEHLTPDSIPNYNSLIKKLNERNIKHIVTAAKLELELHELNDEEQQIFRQEYNLPDENIVDKIIKTTYDTLNLISFLTANEKEAKAWTIKKGTTAYEAAGCIHSDIQKGFVKALVVSFNDFVSCNCLISECREKGLLKAEGKDYIIKDGDIIEFRFNKTR